MARFVFRRPRVADEQANRADSMGLVQIETVALLATGVETMKRLFGLALVVAAGGSVVSATDLNLRAVSGGSNSIVVAPGAEVSYEILGLLSSDTDNQGLALFGYDVGFSGGPIDALSCTPTVASFVIPEGINNPAGCGGTLNVPAKEGMAVQVGGAQNTINNVDTNAAFPIGVVVLNIGHTEDILSTGTLTAPSVEGVYTLSISDGFANVISATQPGGIDFMVVEEVLNVTTEVLTIEVGGCTIDSSLLPDCAIDAGQDTDIDGSGTAGWDTIQVTLSCAADTIAAGDITVTASAGTPPVILEGDIVRDDNNLTIPFTAPIPAGAWTCVEIGGTQHCLGSLPSDVGGDGTAAPGDVMDAMDCLNSGTCALYACDTDRSGECGAADILRTVDLLNGVGGTVWQGMSLGACPSASPP